MNSDLTRLVLCFHLFVHYSLLHSEIYNMGYQVTAILIAIQLLNPLFVAFSSYLL